MKLLDNINCEKGITLNSQLVDLLLILDDTNLTVEQQDKKIKDYIEKLKIRQENYQKASKKGVLAKYQFIVEDVISSVEGLTPEYSEMLKEVYLASLENLSICNKEKMIQKLSERGIDESFHTMVVGRLNSIDYTAKEGILLLTPDKVRGLHKHMFENGNKYDRITFDNVGKYSGYVGFDGETYTTEKIERMQKFCENHKMKSKINALMFYCDFPMIYEKSLDNRVQNGEITEEEKKNLIQKSLFDYVRNIGQTYGNRIESVDIFNELIYDPDMKEDGFDEDSPEYQYRTKGWHKYLSLEDMCKMALIARKEMPNVTFTYNDMNWTEPKKREEMINLIKQIQTIENKFRTEGIEIGGELVKLGKEEKMIDTIGFESHLTTDVDLEEMDNAFLQVFEELGLPIEITELDVACFGENLGQEQKKQGKVLEKIMQIIHSHPEVKSLTIWSQSDECSFMNLKNSKNEWQNVHASILDSHFREKDIDLSKEMNLQNFNYHTHTALCGHADGSMEDYIQKAIKGGITSLGFSDHVPNPLGKSDPKHEMSIEQFHNVYINDLKKLKEKYSGKIDIKIGLESEYYGKDGEPVIKKFREDTEGSLDYTILGQHTALARDNEGKIIMNPRPHNSSKNSIKYPLDYAYAVVEAIESGKFAYVAHPDIFLEERDNIPKEDEKEYEKNVELATKMICEKASEYQIPLEVNLGSISAIEAGIKSKMKDGSYAYPVPEFWRVAQEYGCQVLIGIDAHSPDALLEKNNELIAKRLLKDEGIELNYLDSFVPLGIGKENTRKKQENTIKQVVNSFAKDKEVAFKKEGTQSMFQELEKEQQKQIQESPSLSEEEK